MEVAQDGLVLEQPLKTVLIQEIECGASGPPLGSDCFQRLFAEHAQEPSGSASASAETANISHVLEVLRRVQDLSTGSDELLESAEETGIRSLLSPLPANLLRPFRHLLGGRVLQIGTGDGTLTRYLAECGAEVHAVERNAEFARVARLRCRDLQTVSIFDSVANLPSADTGYEAIVAVRPAWFRPDTPLHEVITGLRSRLTPGGVLFAAFENPLALDSVAASRSSDLSTPKYYGRQDLEEAFRVSGLAGAAFFYVFPSLDESRVIFTQRCANEEAPNLENVLGRFRSSSADGRDLEGLWRSVLRNKLLPDLSSAFLVVASEQRVPELTPPETLLYSFSTARRRHFSCQTLLRKVDENLIVSRSRIFPEAVPPAASLYKEREYDEPYFGGQPFLNSLRKVLRKPGWAPREVAEWAEPWISLLDKHARAESFVPYIGVSVELRVLPTEFVDCIPSNILVGKDGSLQAFDFEYETLAPIPVKFVVFRGLFYALMAVDDVASPVDPWDAQVAGLIVEIMRLSGLPLSGEEVDSLIATEADLQNTITASSRVQVIRQFREARLPIPETAPESTASFYCELFWKSDGAEYDGSRSAGVTARVGSGRGLLTIPIPPLPDVQTSFRLDPCNRPGIVYIFGIRLFDVAGECIWAWNGDRAAFGKVCAAVFADPPLGGSGTLAYFESDDPSFELPIGTGVMEAMRGGGRLELEMSFPASPDYMMLSRRLLDAGGYQEEIRSLRAENRILGRTRDSAIRDMTTTSAQLAAAAAQRDELQRQFESAVAEREQVNRDMDSRLSKIASMEGEIASMEQLRRELAELQHRSEQTQVSLNEVSAERNRLQGAQAQLQAELANAHRQVERLTARTIDLERGNVALQHINREIHAQSGEIRHQVSQVWEHRDRLENEVSRLRGQTVGDRGENTDMQVDMDQFKRELQDNRQQLQRQQQEIKAIYNSLIWRTLVAFSSPFARLFKPGAAKNGPGSGT
jgi:hypothetical protein